MDTKSQRILNIYETGVSETELTETLKTKINASAGGSLGSIKPTDAAPTPARNGNYTFSIGGDKPAWLTAEAGVTTVKAGDGVAVVYAEPSSYTYTHVDVSSVINSSPFVNYDIKLVGIIDIKIMSISQTYLKYAVQWFWRNSNGHPYYLRLQGWNGTAWVTVGDWQRTTDPTVSIEQIDIENVRFTINWDLVVDGLSYSNLAEIKSDCYFIETPAKLQGNLSYDVFPFEASINLLGFRYFKIYNALKDKIYYISNVENLTEYRRFNLHYCDLDGTNDVELYVLTIMPTYTSQYTELVIDSVQGHKLSYKINWNEVVSISGLTKDTGALLKSVYAQTYQDYDVFESATPTTLMGIKYAKVIGNVNKERIFYIEAFEKNTSYRRIYISSCDADGSNNIRNFSWTVFAVDFKDSEVITISDGLTMSIELYVDWTLNGDLVGGTYLENKFLKSVYFPSGVEADNSGYDIKDNINSRIIVDCLGNGDVTTIAAAYSLINDSYINKQYEIAICPGIYNEQNLIPPPFTHTHGIKPNTVVVHSQGFDGTLPVFDQRNSSSKLSNMKIISYTGYCIHYDYKLNRATLKNENLHLKQTTTNAVIGGGSFQYGTHFNWKNIIIEGGAVACHTNVNANYENTHLVFENCKLLDGVIALGNVGGFGHCVCEINGLVTPKGNRSLQLFTSNLRTLDLPNTYFANNFEWQVIGGGNVNFLPYVYSTAEGLRFQSANYSDSILLSGTAVQFIFGNVNYKNGNTRIKATAEGLYFVKDEQAGGTTDVYQMWKRLGDCSLVNKTLSVTIGSTTQTYTFALNYLTTKTAESTILAEINSAITIAQLSKYVPTAWENINTSEKQFVVVTEEIGILSGEWVTGSGLRCPENSKKEDVYGIALENGISGENIQVWVGNAFYITNTDGEYGIDANGVLSINATPKVGYIKNNIFYRF